MSKKRPKRRGRPPKFVVDENGKEVYGLSYNEASGMFYATFSNPRVYFCGGREYYNGARALAIEHLREFEKRQHLTPEQQEESEFLIVVYDKIRELIASDNKIVHQALEDKARELLNCGKFPNLVEKATIPTLEKRLKNHEYDDYVQNYLKSHPLLAFIYDHVIELMPKIINDERIYEALSQKVEEMIKTKPVRAAKLFGIKELVYFANKPFESKLKWSLAWKIFFVFHNPDELTYPLSRFKIVHHKLNVHLHDYFIHEISKIDLGGALNRKIGGVRNYDMYSLVRFDNLSIEEAHKKAAQNIMEPYLTISSYDRLKILEHVFRTVRLQGFPECEHVIDLIYEIRGDPF